MGVRAPLVLTILTCAALFISSCGRKAPPVPPGALKPSPPEDITYKITRYGAVISWTVPTKNTDGSPIVGLKGFEIAKATSSLDGRDSCPTCPRAYSNPVWIPFKGSLRQGASMVFEDRTLQTGKRYWYKIRTVKGIFSKSAYSEEISFAWHAPLDSPEAPSVRYTPQGILLEWHPPKRFLDMNPVLSEDLNKITYSVRRKAQAQENWVLIRGDMKNTSLLDTSINRHTDYTYAITPVYHYFGTPIYGTQAKIQYFYRARAQHLKRPIGLIAVRKKDGIELHWTGELEAGQGYRIYRQKRRGIPVPLNQEPIRDNVFLDTTALPEGEYVYWVTVVSQKAHGLEGPMSNKAKIKIERP